MERVKCNFCGSDDCDSLGIFLDIPFGIPGEFPYVRCRQCGLIYLQHRPSLDEIEEFYPSQYQPYRLAIQDERFPWMRWVRKRNIEKYCRVVREAVNFENGRVLDIGCSTGIFLDAMRQHGWEPMGVEISAHAVQYARQRFHLGILQGQLGDLHCESSYFDAITLWNVFEHLYHPFETLKESHRLLKEHGVLVMVFPSWESLDRRLFGKAWVGFDAPRHLYIYPRDVYTNMLRDAGFKSLKILPGPNNYFAFTASLERWIALHIRTMFLRKVIMKLANVPGLRYGFQPLVSLVDSIGKGGTNLVIAWKNNRYLAERTGN